MKSGKKYLLLRFDRCHVLEWESVGVGVGGGVGDGVHGVVAEVGSRIDQVVVVQVVVGHVVAVHQGSLHLWHTVTLGSRSLHLRQTSGLHILENNVKFFLRLHNVLSVGNVGIGNLRSLDVVVDGGQHGVVPGLGGSEGGHEVRPRLLDLHCVLHRESCSHGQAEDQFVHVAGGEEREYQGVPGSTKEYQGVPRST